MLAVSVVPLLGPADGVAPARVTATGPAELGTAGAGDVLSGVCGALLASGLTAIDAGAVAAWVHGTAARSASRGGPLVARDVAEALPGVLGALRRTSD